MNEKIKFLADSNLGKLAKWLRVLGYDTTCYSGEVGRSFLTKAQKEGRIALTRRRDMALRQYSGKLAVIEHDLVGDQLEEVIGKLSIVPDEKNIMTICLTCNERLKSVSKEAVSGLVPEYIFRQHMEFHICPRCEKIFWPGSHRKNIDQFLVTRILSPHP
jgi:uncharacterized protein with PIN domain